MTDDIFDYFGGNSPRKIEPIEHDDMFDDLMPKVEPEAAEIPEPAEEAVVEEDVVAQPTQNDVHPVDIAADSTSDEDQAAADPWDSLASSFGLAPAAKPAKAAAKEREEAKPVAKEKTAPKNKPLKKKEVVRDEIEIIEDVEVVQEAAPTATDDTEDFFGFHSETKSDSEPPEVLAEMFTPSQDEEFDTAPNSGTTRMVDDVDPFAAFHGSDSFSNEEEEVEEPTNEVVESNESELIVSDDFVEFEVKDLERENDDKQKTATTKASQSLWRKNGITS